MFWANVPVVRRLFERSLVFDEASFVSLLTYSQPANSSPAQGMCPTLQAACQTFGTVGN